MLLITLLLIPKPKDFVSINPDIHSAAGHMKTIIWMK